MTQFNYKPVGIHQTIQMSTQATEIILGTFEVNTDGYYVWFPKQDLSGYYNEFFLQTLLTKLQELNQAWDAQVQKELSE